MKYQMFTYSGPGDAARPGLAVAGQFYDLRALLGDRYLQWTCVDDLLHDWTEAHGVLQELTESAARNGSTGRLEGPLQFLPPLTRCGVVYGAGANYRDHVEAMARAMNMQLVLDPKTEGIPPWHFIKAGQATLAAHQQTVPMPEHTQKLDWEAELAVVIGRRASRVSVEDALHYVAGYSCANDLSARDNLRREKVDAGSPFQFDWIGHKCFSGSCPLGPFITPREYVASPEELDIKLWVNGELKQDSNTRNHLYSVAEQISYLSHRLDLRPGDVLLTGTPAGTGAERGVFLQKGDIVKVWIDGLGELETPIS